MKRAARRLQPAAAAKPLSHYAARFESPSTSLEGRSVVERSRQGEGQGVEEGEGALGGGERERYRCRGAETKTDNWGYGIEIAEERSSSDV